MILIVKWFYEFGKINFNGMPTPKQDIFNDLNSMTLTVFLKDKSLFIPYRFSV